MIKLIDVAIVIKVMRNFIFNSFMLIYLTHVSMFEKWSYDLRKMSQITKAIYVAITIKFMKHCICAASC